MNNTSQGIYSGLAGQQLELEWWPKAKVVPYPKQVSTIQDNSLQCLHFWFQCTHVECNTFFPSKITLSTGFGRNWLRRRSNPARRVLVVAIFVRNTGSLSLPVHFRYRFAYLWTRFAHFHPLPELFDPTDRFVDLQRPVHSIKYVSSLSRTFHWTS